MQKNPQSDPLPNSPPEAPVVVVHSLEEALRALSTAARLARPIYIASAEAVGAAAGPLWFKALAAAAAQALEDSHDGAVLAGAILDCGPYAGPVMEALDLGMPLLRFTGPAPLAAKLQALAAARGARVIADALNAFDCRDRRHLEKDLAAWLLATKQQAT